MAFVRMLSPGLVFGCIAMLFTLQIQAYSFGHAVTAPHVGHNHPLHTCVLFTTAF